MHLSRFDQYYRIIERRVQEVLSPGALRITTVAPPSTAAFFVSRKRVFTHEPPSPWFLFIIYQYWCAAMEGKRRHGRRRYRDTDVLEMLEVIIFVADTMVYKPLLPTNDLWCAAVPSARNPRAFSSQGNLMFFRLIAIVE
jgi:hypothetical protein